MNMAGGIADVRVELLNEGSRNEVRASIQKIVKMKEEGS